MDQLNQRYVDFQRELGAEIDRFVLLWQFQRSESAFRGWWRVALKRAMDFSFSLVGLIAAAPVLAAVALAVKLDSRGPALYSQERVGLRGSTFNIYKFRSMRIDAEAQGPQWAAIDGDPRVTRVGAFLRRTHLDELPQLFNVLRGEMSLVGPRPERPCFTEELSGQIAGYSQRLLIKPGITGLAQVRHRYDQTLKDVKNKLRFDLLYARRMCLLLDARILMWTVIFCLSGRVLK